MTTEPSDRKGKGRDRDRAFRIMLGSAVAGLGLVTVTTAIASRNRDVEQRECLAGIIEQQNALQRVRSEINTVDSAATDRVIIDALSRRSSKQLDQTLEDFITAKAKVNQMREMNPVPVLEDDFCRVAR